MRAIGLVSLLGLGGVTACQPAGSESEAAQSSEVVKVVNVEVAGVTTTDFTAYIRLTGQVEAFDDVTLSAEEGGVIERFFVEKGRYVRAGAPLAKIRDRVLSAQVDEATAAAELARERYERQRQLWEEEQIGSEIAYLEAKYQAELQAARLETLKARLERTLLTSPLGGVFDERYVDAGEMVAVGTRVARVVDVDRLKVTGGVAERFAGTVEPGDTARIKFDVLPGQEFLGVIRYVGVTVDTRNRTFPAEVVLKNPGRAIKPQMVANVEIANRRLRDVFVAPQSAILRTESGYQVFVASERDGRLVATPRPVRLGPSYANRTVIEEGLTEGEQLIVRGQQLVEAGDYVRILNADTAGTAAEDR